MAVNDGAFLGWPFVNHAMEVRGTQTPSGAGRSTIVYPRRKFTFVVEFAINPRALDSARMETNLIDFLRNGRLYTTLRSIDHPKPTMATEKLRSYNKHVIIPTKFDYPPASMSFHDDDSSIAAALWKEYRAFYQYEGRIGANAIRSNAPSSSLIQEFRQGNDLVGDNVRADMSGKPSLGMRIKENDGRHFFDSIIIYDLGSEPDSVNVYSFLYPVVTGLDHDGLDYEDRNGQVGMSMTFDYEGYYQLVGVNNSQFQQIIEQFLGLRPVGPTSRVPGHARMTPPSASSSPVSLTGGSPSTVVTTPSSVPIGSPTPSTIFPITPPEPITVSPIGSTFDPGAIGAILDNL